MKKEFLLLPFLTVALFGSAQNTGIGTSTPQATLDVKGNQRIGGSTRYMTFDSASGKIEWKNSNLFIPVSLYLFQHSAAADGLYYNNNAPTSGQLEYRNAIGYPVFYTNFINGNGYFSNNLGIGNNAPLFPLSFGQAPGDKISLWCNSSNTYGFGIQSSLLQIHTIPSGISICSNARMVLSTLESPTDVDRRFAEHLGGKGARYTRSHPPRCLLASAPVGGRSDALKAELALKALPRAEKLTAILSLASQRGE